MYKGYKIKSEGAFYKIYDQNGMVCGIGTESYLAKKSEKAIIDELIAHNIPRPPKKRIETEVRGNELQVNIICSCPDCGWVMGKSDDEWKYHHCAQCGQIIDWGKL